MTNGDKCGNCRFWNVRSDEVGNRGGGFCRRYPPQFPTAWTVYRNHPEAANAYDIAPSSVLNDAWPNTFESSWCGEYEVKP